MTRLAIALSLLSPATAWPQEDPHCEAPSSERAAREEAGRRFQAGMDAVGAGDHPTALYEFLCSFQIRAHPYTAYNIARAADQIHHAGLAVEYYRIYLHLAGETDERAEVETRLAELERQLSNRPGRLRVDAAPEGASVVVDGELMGRAPLENTVSLPPGRHHVQVSARGHADRDQYVGVTSGEESAVSITLVPLGEWREAEGGRSPLVPVLWGAAALAVAGGLWLGVQASDQAAEFRSLRDDDASFGRLRSQRDSAQSTALVADVCYVVGLVAGGLGLYLYMTPAAETAPGAQATR